MNCEALLFGINEYVSLSPIGCAEQDATAVAAALRTRCGFSADDVRLIKPGAGVANAPFYRVVKRRLEELRDAETPLDLLVVGFWGHGVVDDRDGKLYLCAADSDKTDLAHTAVALETLQRHIVMSGAANALLILDCCQNVLAREADPSSAAVWTKGNDEELSWVRARDVSAYPVGAKTRPQPERRRRFATINACSVGQRAYEWGKRGHGLLTAHFLDALDSGVLSYTALTTYLSENVRKTARELNCEQTPSFRFDGDGDLRLDMAVPKAAKGAKFVVPDDPNKIKIEEPEIGEFRVDVESVALEDAATPTLDGAVELPPAPEEIRKLRGEIAGIVETLGKLNDGTHPALAKAREAIDEAARQTAAIEKRRDEIWADYPADAREALREAIRRAPTGTVVSFLPLKPASTSVAKFGWPVVSEKKALEAKSVEEKTRAAFETKRKETTTELEKRRTEAEARLEASKREFCDSVLKTILSRRPGYGSSDAAFPDEEMLSVLPVLDEYRLGWSDVEYWKRAVEIWNGGGWVGSRAGERREVEIKGAKYGFCWAPPGEFEMGSPEDEEGRYDDETQHEVRLPQGFWIGETPVTRELWEAVTGDNPSCFKGTNLPEENVSWEDCQKFIEKLNGLGVVPNDLKFRLPTEAEWEYACRAGTSTAYWWGNELNGDKANCDGNYPCGTTTEGKYLEKTTPVKSYGANAWGLYDTHGNVWEWCSDWYGDYPSGVVEAPTGPTSASDRVIRGGSWYFNAGSCRSAIRNLGLPSDRDSGVGLRLVLSSSK